LFLKSLDLFDPDLRQSERKPLISIVIPLYNKEKEVLRAINSVLSQTVKDFEVIVVNDGSTDKGPGIVRSISDPRIRVIDQDNAGVSAARNRGIEAANTDLITFLDADDEWEPEFLETILWLEREFPDCSVFATSYFFVNRDGIKSPAVVRGLPKDFQKGILKDYFIIAAKSDPPLWTSAIAVKKSAILDVGGFPEGIVSGEDLLTWARLASKFDIAYYVEPKAFFWKSDSFSIRPSRRPNIPDLVGKELSLLFKTGNFQKVKGLKKYLALWHRMRAIFFIQIHERLNSLREIRLSFGYSPSLKLCLLFFIALLPLNFSKEILSILRRR
jgi:glycosyltransferase involved in cell wall biosynthesis